MISKTLAKKIWLLAFPVILTNLLQASMTIIDTLMVGRLGPTALAAVGMGNVIRLLVLISILSVTGGAMSLMAQAVGARDPKRMGFVVRQSLVAGLLISVVVALIGIGLSAPLLRFMSNGESQEIIKLGTGYLYVIFLGTPFIVLNFTINRLMQGAGDTRTPFYLSFCMLVLNVLLNLVFIFGFMAIPPLGIIGVAVATVLSRVIMAAIGIYILYSGKNIVKILSGSWKPDTKLIKDIMSIGVPSGIQGIFRHGSNLIIISLVTATTLGAFGAAAFSICTQIESVVAYMAVGLNVAATAMVGKELGKWQTEEAYYKGNVLIYLGLLMMIILVIPIIIFAQELMLLFDPSATTEILEGGISYLNSNSYFLPISAFGILITGTLRGAGDTKPAMISAIIGRNITAIFFAYIFAFPMGMDYKGVWYGIIIGRFVDAIYLWIVWRAQKWKMVALKKTEIYRRHLTHLPKEVMDHFLSSHRRTEMAQENTIEIVTNNGVIYSRPKGRVEFLMNRDNGTFQLQTN